MKSFLSIITEPESGIVLRASRRWIEFIDRKGDEHRGMSSTSILEDITIGDIVSFKKEGNEIKVISVHERKNFLARQSNTRIKRIAANLNHLYIVTALGPLLNFAFIDRILCAAEEQNIPSSIILNKIDLPNSDVEGIIEYYEKIGIPILRTSAKAGDIHDLESDFGLDNKNIVSFAGLSGVGKSSLLNVLVPDAARNTANVSTKTGQGKQTTSQSMAYRYKALDSESLIIDLPGIQNFGITYLDKHDIMRGMPDILRYAPECEYSDCAHLAESSCAVKDALDTGEIALFRYESYCSMLEEIEDAREY